VTIGMYSLLFDTRVELRGPPRQPAQLLGEQTYDGHGSLHDPVVAAGAGLAGAPIEGAIHLSQFDPLTTLLWGDDWFRRGCISCHFRTMVFEGESVQALVTTDGPRHAAVDASKLDGTSVLTGTASVRSDDATSEARRRLGSLPDPAELYILDRVELGMRESATTVRLDFDEQNGDRYPFSLAEKLAVITEWHPWYTEEGASDSPWGRPIVPMEMISVLAHKSGGNWPIRRPFLGLYLDLEIRLLAGPVFVGVDYEMTKEIVGLSHSPRTESYWMLTALTETGADSPTAEILLHTGVLKDSHPGYPPALLGN
jgi:hypothetical protein